MTVLFLLSIFTLVLFVPTQGNSNLQGKSGSLRVTTDEDDEGEYNQYKLVVFFDDSCATTEADTQVKRFVYFHTLYLPGRCFSSSQNLQNRKTAQTDSAR